MGCVSDAAFGICGGVHVLGLSLFPLCWGSIALSTLRDQHSAVGDTDGVAIHLAYPGRGSNIHRD